jgi:site-specific DNA-methyltransferase (adenine-specific)
MELLKATPDKFYDLAIVDPPYGIGDTFISNSTGNKKGKLERIHKKIDWDNEIPSIEYFNELKRVSKKQVIWGANYFNCFDGGACVWYKNRGGNTLSQCEIASVSGQKKVDYVEIQILTGFVSNEIRIHPTQKPVKLYEWLLTNYAKQGDKILDTHGGSMSSVIASLNLGYEIVCSELDVDYYNAGVARVLQSQKQQRMFE